jgi:16S rRNA U1498 N3-methylase RsmE
VKGVGRGARGARLAGEAAFEPPPGSEGAPLPWIEIALAWPKGNRFEEMLDRLTQLGAAAIADLRLGA